MYKVKQSRQVLEHGMIKVNEAMPLKFWEKNIYIE